MNVFGINDDEIKIKDMLDMYFGYKLGKLLKIWIWYIKIFSLI